MRAREVEHRQLHAAGDVDADAVRDHGALGREHAADRQAVAAVGVGHERAPHGRRQAQRVLHLVQRALLGVAAPGLERRRRVPLREGDGERCARADQLLGDRSEVGVAGVRVRVGDHVPELGQRLVPPEPLDRSRQRVQRHAEERPGLEADRDQVVSADARHAERIIPAARRLHKSGQARIMRA